MFDGSDAGRFSARGTSIVASNSPMVNETSWSMTWTAPATAPMVFIDLGVVGGDGQTSQMTLTDPLGDETAMAHYVATAIVAARGLIAVICARAIFGAMLSGCRSPSSAPASSD